MASSEPPAPQAPFPTEPILHLPPNLTVRPYIPSDIPSLSQHANNINLWNNLRNRLPHPYTPAEAAVWIAHNCHPKNHVRSGPWNAEDGSQGPLRPANYAVCIDNVCVGSIGLEFGAPDEVYARSAEIGYWLGEAYWGQGIMSRVAPAFVKWVWDTWGMLVRLNAEVFQWNEGSRRVLEKAGFVVEGVKRLAVVKNGVVGDLVVLGMVRPGLE